LTTGRIAAARGWFNGIRQVAPVCNTTTIRWAHPNAWPKRYLDRFSLFCTAHYSVPLGCNRPPLPLKIADSHGEIWTPSNTRFLGPTRVFNPNGISIGSAVFAGLTNVLDW